MKIISIGGSIPVTEILGIENKILKFLTKSSDAILLRKISFQAF